MGDGKFACFARTCEVPTDNYVEWFSGLAINRYTLQSRHQSKGENLVMTLPTRNAVEAIVKYVLIEVKIGNLRQNNFSHRLLSDRMVARSTPSCLRILTRW